MAGPSKKVQGGYLGYSALTDAYWSTLNQVRKGQTQRLEQEKLELQNEAAVNDLFSLPGAPASQGSALPTSKGGSAPTVVTNAGFSYTANINDPKLMEFLTPPAVDPSDPEAYALDNYKKNVSQQQKELFKGKDFSLDGSATQAGGGFNNALQGALEGLKSEYVKAGRKTSPRKRRESRLQIRNQLQALQTFSSEVQSVQGAYKQAYDSGIISYGTGSEFIDFLNTVSGPNDLEVKYDGGRGFLVGTSSAGKNIVMPLDNLEGLKNGLVTKQNNPAPVVNQLVQQVNKVVEGVDERGVKTQSNEWTEETTNNVQNALSQLLPDTNSVISMGIDWLGLNGTQWKKKVQSDPEGSKQLILDTLANHVKSQHTPVVKGGLTEDQYQDNQLASDKFDETRRHNRVSERQAQERIDKPSGGGGKNSATPEDRASDIASNLNNPAYWASKSIDGKKVAKSGIQGGVLTLDLITGNSKGKPVTVPIKYNLSDDQDIERLAREIGADSATITQLKSYIGSQAPEKGNLDPLSALGAQPTNIKSNKKPKAYSKYLKK